MSDSSDSSPSSSSASTSSTTITPTTALPKPVKKESFLPPHIASYFVAGGIAGAASRTVVSPLERLKIIQQVQPKSSTPTAYSGVWRSLVRMWKEEGFKGFMRGNGANCIRIIPYSAVQFTSYEQLKKWLTNNGQKPLDTPTRLTAGALAGITSVCSTYPLDLVRARLSILSASIEFATATAPAQASTSSAVATALSSSTSALPSSLSLVKASSNTGAIVSMQNMPALSASLSTSALSAATTSYPKANAIPKLPSMWGMLVIVFKDEGGIRGLYRGLIPTAVGVAPYVGINFTAYETLRIFITPPEHKNSIFRKLLCGALAGSISQTLTYPFDVLRRKMQVVGMKATSSCGSLGYQYNGAWDALRTIARTEGFRGLYRGIWPNLLKVAPSIATSFFTYELVKEHLLA